MKNDLIKYREKLNFYNNFEDKVKLSKKLSAETRIKQHFALMDLGLKILPKAKIKKIQKAKLKFLIEIQQKLMRIRVKLK